jgi:hypothetical protein
MKKWHRIAEKLCESGWSWNHANFTDRSGRKLHVAEVHNEGGVIHAAMAKTASTAFTVLENSVKSAE